MRPPLRLLTAALFASTFASPVSAGTPIFGTPAIPGVSAWNSPAFVDIDADGDLDLFVGDSGGNTFFYENVGTAAAPAFGEPTIDPFGLAGVAGTDIAAPTFGDIDADGDFDAFIGVRVLPTSPAVGSTLFYENTGTATAPAFEPPATNPFGLANVAGNASPELADVDDDGDLDAFVGENAGNTVFFENTGTASAPSFAAAVANPFGLADVGTAATPTLADVDLDGDLDVLIGNTVGNSLFFENTGTAASPAFATPIANPHGLVQVQLNAAPALADIDADGDLDAFVGNRWGRVVSFRNLGTPGAPAFLGPVTNPFGLSAVGNLAAPALADVDGDGDFDAFVGDQAGDTSFFENTGSATAPAFASPLTNPFGLVGVEGPASPALADIDADGDFDLFVGSNGGSTSFFENVGTNAAPSFAAPVPNAFGLADVEALAAPAFADIDGDGDLDAFFGDAVGNTSFFENTGTATAPAFAAPATNPFGLADVEDAAAPFFADVDGDGDLDGFSGHLGAPVPGQGSVVFFENTGTAATPAFAAPLTDPFGLIQLGAYVHPAFVDLDGDGDLDAFFGEGGGNTVFFENLDRGSGTCADGIDNDFDGLADAGADAGCASAADPDERSAIGCDDGIDNDLDGKLDWRGDGTGDPDCTSLLDGTEAVPPGWACGLGPELGLLLPAFTWLSRRRIRARDAPRAIA